MSESLYSLLQHAAGRWPDRPAVDFAGDTLTYAEFMEQADRAAAAFRERGAGPGMTAAFCFQKSVDALVALFGLIRTGATYVPLDPAWPRERITAICADAGAQLWIGTRHAPPDSGIDVSLALLPDDDAPSASGHRHVLRGAIDRAAPDRAPPAAPAGGVANVLYTSGSTGRPKGVRITTRSLLHFSQWAIDFFGLNHADRLSNHAPYTFDLSTFDIFAAVGAGAAMVPVPERLRMFPYQVASFVAERRITVWYSVPSALVMMQLRGRLAGHDLSRLRHVIFAGEVMPKQALQALVRDLPHPAYTNLYGPTETNVCTFHRVAAADLASDDPLPIGRPIAATRVWLVDDKGRSVAALDGDTPECSAPGGPGAEREEPVGEILVAGPTVTPGYLNDAELSAQRLVPAPDGPSQPSSPRAIYRTGDRGRLRADGALMFEGRLDRQIKCRGHRIEPGDIEAALSQHASVGEAAVVPVPDPVFGNRIKACVAPRDGHTLVEADLIAHCHARLPPYMTPDLWDIRAVLPRNDRGKIDFSSIA